MFLNPPNQFLEKMIGIPPSEATGLAIIKITIAIINGVDNNNNNNNNPPEFTIKRTVFRTLIIAFLLFLAESLPTFSGILQVGKEMLENDDSFFSS